jgi:hypothetical protein
MVIIKIQSWKIKGFFAPFQAAAAPLLLAYSVNMSFDESYQSLAAVAAAAFVPQPSIFVLKRDQNSIH